MDTAGIYEGHMKGLWRGNTELKVRVLQRTINLYIGFRVYCLGFRVILNPKPYTCGNIFLLCTDYRSRKIISAVFLDPLSLEKLVLSPPLSPNPSSSK